MKSKIIKSLGLSFALILLLGGCTFPWESERASISVDDPTYLNRQQDNNVNNDEGKKEEEIKIFEYSTNLRKLAGLSGLKTYLEKFPKLSGQADVFAVSPKYQGIEAINAKVYDYSSILNFEPDIVKVSGDYLFVLAKNEIRIIDIRSVEEAEKISSISFDFSVLEFAISGNYLVVAGSQKNVEGIDKSYLRAYDVTVPREVKLTASLEVEGIYAGLLGSGSYAYLLSSTGVKNTNSNILPVVSSQGSVLSPDCSQNQDCINTSIYYFDNNYSDHILFSVSALRLQAAPVQVSRQIYLLDSQYQVYASADANLYFSRGTYLEKDDLISEIEKDKLWNNLSEDEQNRIKQVEETPIYTLSAQEKNAQIKTIIDAYLKTLPNSEQEAWQGEIEAALTAKMKEKFKQLELVDIYKFTLDAGSLSYQAKGQAQGRLLDKRSFDEEDGALRLVTFRGPLWHLLFSGEEKSYSNIYIFDNNLSALGSLENIAGYSLSDALYTKDRVYLISDKDKAPIYVVGLEEKSSPEILGALQISSSKYLYPIDNSGKKILTLGRNEPASDSEEQAGIRLSLYDFSDLSSPSEMSSYVIGDSLSTSLALDDYRALFNSGEKRTIALPVSFNDNTVMTFSGILLFSYDTSGKLTLDKRIDHSMGGHFLGDSAWRGYTFKDNTVLRSFIDDNNLFTVSNKYLKVINLSTLEELKSLNLEPNAQEDEVVAQEQKARAEAEARQAREEMINLDEDMQIGDEEMPSPEDSNEPETANENNSEI